MPSRSARAALVMTLVVGATPALAQDAPWRVEVQTSRGRVLPAGDPTPGPTLVVDGAADHVVRLVDEATGRVLRSEVFADGVVSAALAWAQGRLAVSTRGGETFVIELSSGARRALAGTTGLVVFDRDARRLGVLGRAPRLDGSEAPHERARLDRGSALGVFDLAQGAWVARADTPILRDVHARFDGEALYGCGPTGPGVFNRSMRPVFLCWARLTLGPGGPALEVQTSGELERGEPPAGFALPEPLRAGSERLRRERERRALAPTFQAGASIAHGTARRAALVQVLQGQGATTVATLGVDARGSVIARLARWSDDLGRPGALAAAGERVAGVATRYGDDRTQTDLVLDVERGEALVALPPGATVVATLASGVLVGREGERGIARWSFAAPGASPPDAPAWRACDGPKPHDERFMLAVDRGERAAVLRGDGDGALLRVVRLADGVVAARIPPPDGVPASTRPWGLCIESDGERARVLVVHEHRAFVHDVASGRWTSAPLPSEAYAMGARSTGPAWLATGNAQALALDRDGAPAGAAAVALPDIYRVTPAGDRLLVEARDGHAALLDAATLAVRERWLGAPYQSMVDPPELGPHAALAFDGRALARSLGHSGALELARLDDPALRVTLTPVVVAGALGWIATTPDGLWDASPGAEAQVAVLRGTRDATAEETAARRAPDELARRLRALAN